MEKKLHSDFLKVRAKNTYILPHAGGLIGGDVMCPRGQVLISQTGLHLTYSNKINAAH